MRRDIVIRFSYAEAAYLRDLVAGLVASDIPGAEQHDAEEVLRAYNELAPLSADLVEAHGSDDIPILRKLVAHCC